MKAETKAKIKVKVNHFVNAVKEWTVPILVTTTIAAAWDGHIQSKKNQRAIEGLRHNQGVIKDVVNHNAECLVHTNDRVSELEKANGKLLGEAINVTEGKESA